MNSNTLQTDTKEGPYPTLPKYDIHSVIAEGSTGTIFLGTQKSLNRKVAIKFLPDELSKNPDFRDSFIAEAKAMAKLNHPNLIGLHDFGELDETPYFIMEYVDGSSLKRSANGQPIDPAEATRIVIETLNGLANAHEEKILHRNLSPEEILLNSDQAEVKLGNFCLNLADHTVTNDNYTAPELTNQPHSKLTDLYSVGIILYELLTGQLPGFPYTTPTDIVQCDERLNSILAKALQSDPSLRYQSATEFVDALKSLSAPTPITGPVLTQTAAVTTPPSPAAIVETPISNPLQSASTPVKPPSDNKTTTIVIVTIITAILISGGLLALKSSNKEPEEKLPLFEDDPHLSGVPSEKNDNLSSQASPTSNQLLVEEQFLLGGKNYIVDLPLNEQMAEPLGMFGNWITAPKASPLTIFRSSLDYPDPLYAMEKGGSIKAPLSAGLNRQGRLLTTSYNDESEGTVYLSFLMQTPPGKAHFYRGFELHNGGLLDGKHRVFQIGYKDSDFESHKGKRYGFRAGTNSFRRQLKRNNGKPTLFVVKFELSQTPKSDAVTVWQDPDLSSGYEPSGGFFIFGFDIAFDRISVAKTGQDHNTSWDEFRIGHSFAAVTTN